MHQTIGMRTDPQTKRSYPTALEGAKAIGGLTVAGGLIYGLYAMCNALFIFLAGLGLGIWGCWGLTLLAGLFALYLIANIISNISGGM